MSSPSYSVLLDGSSQYISTPSTSSLAPGTGNFTYEAWIYPTSVTAIGSSIISSYVQLASPGDHGIRIALNSTRNIFGEIKQDNSTSLGIATSGTYALNQWHHVVFTRVNSTVSLFVNGVRAGTGTSTINSTENNITLGRQYVLSGTVNMLFAGHISNARVVIGGTQPYDPTQSTITVPTSPLVAIANTALLTCNASSISDGSIYNLSLTSTGSPPVSTFCAFLGSLGKKRSVQYNGTNQYLRLADNLSAFNFGTGDFTEECWFYTTQVASQVSVNSMFVGGTSVGSGFTVRTALGGSIAWTSGNTDVCQTAISTNTWYHVAYARQSGTGRFFVNGTQQTASADTLNYSSNSWNVLGTWVNSNSMYFTGNISNFRVIKGTALYTASFSVPTAPLNAITNTVFFVGPEDTITDGSTNNFAVTQSGSPVLSDFSPFFQGSVKLRNTIPQGYSVQLNGSTQYYTTPVTGSLVFGTGDYTVECWLYRTTGTGRMFASGNSLGNYFCFIVEAGKLVTGRIGFAGAEELISTATVPINTWTHLAGSRQSGTARIFIDGVLDKSGTITTNYATPSGVNYLGSDASNFTNGYVSNLRVIKGQAIYTASFTVPTAPLSAVANTQLLTFNDSVVRDASSNNLTITPVNSPTVSSAVTPFGPTYSSRLKIRNTIPYSVLFNGSSQYLTVADNTALRINTSSFCIEAWVYLNSFPSKTVVFGRRTYNNTGTGTYYIMVNNTATVQFYELQNVVAIVQSSAGAIQSGTWCHLAVSRDASNVVRLFIDGTLVSSATSTFNFNTTEPLWIGRDNALAANYLNGYVSNVRFVIGSPVYTESFTPPTSTLTAITNTVLLTCNADAIKDSSTNNFTVTNVGGATVSTNAPFTPDTRTKFKIYSVT